MLSAAALTAAAAAVILVTAGDFRRMHGDDTVIPGPGMTRQTRLSRYFEGLKGTPGDTDVYVFEGRRPGGSLLVLGGTHPNEPAGFITAVVLVENMSVEQGRVFVIPQANRSGFTHNDPQEAWPQSFAVRTAGGFRRFRFGSRLTNPVHQWPAPTLHVNPAGQKLAGMESRNLNRAYPGRADGSLTEKTAFAVMNLLRRERIDLALDLHEAAPEYPVINAIVFHDNSAELAATALMKLELEGLDFRLEASPPNLRGLSHREWGDHSPARALLLETANVSQGRLRGKTSARLVVEGRDPNYRRADRRGLLFVPYGEEGIPLRLRVSRHLAAVRAILAAWDELEPQRPVGVNGLPAAADVARDGPGAFLHPPK